MLTYNTYLKVDNLIDLQNIQSEPAEHDEMLFIIIHQTYELWFKQVLHEMDFLIKCLNKDDISRSSSTFKRILKIMKTLVGQVDILETMTPLEFKSFREFLDSSSGFQSYQFRTFEFKLGYKREEPLKFQPEGSTGHNMLVDALNSPSLWNVFLNLLARNGYEIPSEVLNAPVDTPTKANKQVQQQLIKVYREDHSMSELCELMVDLDEGLQEWRYRHVKMVQRTIGAKMGSGGSSGAEYLARTLFKPVFPDLWDIRSEL